jgi:hypothetical protein
LNSVETCGFRIYKIVYSAAPVEGFTRTVSPTIHHGENISRRMLSTEERVFGLMRPSRLAILSLSMVRS